MKRWYDCEFKASCYECSNNYSGVQPSFNSTVSVSLYFERLKHKLTFIKSPVFSEKGLARTLKLSLSLLKLILAFISLNLLMCSSSCVNIHLIMPLRMIMCDRMVVLEQHFVLPKCTQIIIKCTFVLNDCCGIV